MLSKDLKELDFFELGNGNLEVEVVEKEGTNGWSEIVS